MLQHVGIELLRYYLDQQNIAKLLICGLWDASWDNLLMENHYFQEHPL